MATTKQYIVRYRRNADDPVGEETFHTQGPAYGFAYNIEANGGIAIFAEVDKDDPLSDNDSVKKLSFD